MNKLLASLSIFAGMLPALLCSADPLMINDAWIREAPPVSKVQAAYMQLHNNSDKDLTLTAASSPLFSRIEFHRTEMSNGMMRMLQEKTLRIPAGGKLHLQPDGIHMMLFNPQQPLHAGDKVPLTLSFSDQQERNITITVKKASGVQQHQHRCGQHE